MTITVVLLKLGGPDEIILQYVSSIIPRKTEKLLIKKKKYLIYDVIYAPPDNVILNVEYLTL